MPPAWAILAMLFLGWDDLLRLLYSPVRLIFVLGLLIVVRAMYIQMDVDAEMRRGLVPGLLSLSAKAVPAALEILRRLADEGAAPAPGAAAGAAVGAPKKVAVPSGASQAPSVAAEPAAESKKEQ